VIGDPARTPGTGAGSPAPGRPDRGVRARRVDRRSLPLAEFLPGFADAVTAGRPARALALLVKGTGIVPGPLGRLPMPVLTAFGGVMMRTDSGRELRRFLPTLPAELAQVIRLDPSAGALPTSPRRSY
jgi:hypothetical protein